jgi:hypothetical protein
MLQIAGQRRRRRWQQWLLEQWAGSCCSSIPHPRRAKRLPDVCLLRSCHANVARKLSSPLCCLLRVHWLRHCCLSRCWLTWLGWLHSRLTWLQRGLAWLHGRLRWLHGLQADNCWRQVLRDLRPLLQRSWLYRELLPWLLLPWKRLLLLLLSLLCLLCRCRLQLPLELLLELPKLCCLLLCCRLPLQRWLGWPARSILIGLLGYCQPLKPPMATRHGAVYGSLILV